MRQFMNTTATIEELELHGFWHRRLETLIITGLTIRGTHGVTTTAFWLSVCRQLDLPTNIVHEQGPAEMLRYLLHRSPSASFSFCVERHEDGTVLFRAPRVMEQTQEGSSQGDVHGDRRENRCRPIRSRATAVPPCRRAEKPLHNGRERGSARQRRSLAAMFDRLMARVESQTSWAASPDGFPRPSAN